MIIENNERTRQYLSEKMKEYLNSIVMGMQLYHPSKVELISFDIENRSVVVSVPFYPMTNDEYHMLHDNLSKSLSESLSKIQFDPPKMMEFDIAIENRE